MAWLAAVVGMHGLVGADAAGTGLMLLVQGWCCWYRADAAGTGLVLLVLG